MKRIKSYLIFLVSLAGLSGCVKNEFPSVKGSFVEFDATTWNANAAGQTYPILTRVPAFGRAVNTSDPLLTKNSGTIKIRVNLVGPHRSTDTQISYSVDAAATTAVAGTHYTALPGTVTIPANSSFGEINLVLLNTATPPPTSVDLVLMLTGGDGDVKANENYKYIGLRIAQ